MVRETHNVNGTLFTFPELPPVGEIAPDLFERLTGDRAKILAAAAKVKTVKPRNTTPRAPRPGNGEFNPKAGAPGSDVYVTLVDKDHVYPSITVMGCVMFPAPGPNCVWLSLWDGRMPIEARLDGDKSAVTIYVSSDEIAARTPLDVAA